MTSRHEKFWDGAAARYDRIEARYQEIHGRAVELTRRHLEADHVVLDCGCGTGTKALALAGDVASMLAIDISSRMIEIARGKAAGQDSENLEFRQATIYDEGLEGESFDVITAFNVLHAVEDGPGVVDRITGLLRPGGLFVSVTPCLREKKVLSTSLRIPFFVLAGLLGLLPRGFTRLTFQHVEDLVGGGELRIVDKEILSEHMSSIFLVARKQA